MLKATLAVLVSCLALSSAHYNTGLCHFDLVQDAYNTSATLQYLSTLGDYTVLFTSGLKQYSDVVCARLGYTDMPDLRMYAYYTYVKTNRFEEFNTYDIRERKPGKMGARPTASLGGVSNQYIVYAKDSILLLYWCKEEATDNNADNIIWIIAAKTSVAGSEQTKKAVLRMLHHDSYSKLIDQSSLVDHTGTKQYTELSPCHE